MAVACLEQHGLEGTRASVLAAVGSVAVAPELWSTGSVSMVHGLVALQLVGSSWTKDQTLVSGTGRRILYL